MITETDVRRASWIGPASGRRPRTRGENRKGPELVATTSSKMMARPIRFSQRVRGWRTRFRERKETDPRLWFLTQEVDFTQRVGNES